MTRRPTTLLLVRHAQATCNVLGDDDVIDSFDTAAPLTDLGRAQARALADWLRAPRPCRVYSSPLLRAAETASALAGRLELDVEHDERLGELHAPPRFAAPMRVREWDALLAARLEHPDREVAPGLEPVRAQYERVRSFLDERGEGEHAVVVSHAFTIDLALRHLLRLGLSSLRTIRFKISPTGVFHVERHASDGYARLVAANSKTHLEALREATRP